MNVYVVTIVKDGELCLTEVFATKPAADLLAEKLADDVEGYFFIEVCELEVQA